MNGFQAEGLEGMFGGICWSGDGTGAMSGRVALEALRALTPPFFARGGGGRPAVAGGGGGGEPDLRMRSSNSNAAIRLGDIMRLRERGRSIVMT